jgi:hypothetical protein
MPIDDQVTVSMPAWRTPPELLHRAVVAVLRQTHRNLRLIVVHDGPKASAAALWQGIDDIRDPRLLRWNLGDRRGRYFIDAVTLAATTSRWWTVHDSDDEAEPGWLESMVALATRFNADVVQADQLVHMICGGEPAMERVPGPTQWAGEYRHFAHMAGLWSADWLRRVGGPHPEYRVGWDTMLSSLAREYGRVAIHRGHPCYHRCRRKGSLTTSKYTGVGSVIRMGCDAGMRELWDKLSASGASDVDSAGAMIKQDIGQVTIDVVARYARLLSSEES